MHGLARKRARSPSKHNHRILQRTARIQSRRWRKHGVAHNSHQAAEREHAIFPYLTTRQVTGGVRDALQAGTGGAV